MQRYLRRVAAFAFAGIAAIAVAGAARAADDYPNRSVRFLVGYPPAGTVDICARLIGQYLSEHLHQQFVVENKPGAGNNLATEMAARAAPDGYTLFLANPANAINATLYKNLSFNFIQDLTPVAGIIRVANVMEVNPNLPAKTVAEFIAYAKANPGKINLASSGIGTSVHMSGALFMMMTGDNLPSSIAYIQGDRLRALAVTTATRNKALPDVPSVSETVPGYEASAFFGVVAPKGTPLPIIDKLNKTVNEALADPALQAKLAELGGTLIPGTPEDFGRIISDETAKWAPVVKATGATAE
jgi:tripartite-type tricarboxylate transporter receptor subunit TctC